uniref:Uncharacterized protein n=1 Tax=Acrobeloides nanus TaxID=290746 RepID=A0A914CSY0_9BILA
MSQHDEERTNWTLNGVNIVDDIDYIYKLDYSEGHPFDNECKFPSLFKDDESIKDYTNHYRAINCPNPDYEPLVTQHRNGEIMKFRALYDHGESILKKSVIG